MSHDRSEQDVVGRFVVIGLLVIYPLARRALFWASIVALSVGIALYWYSFEPSRAKMTPNVVRLVGMMLAISGVGLFGGLWVPSVIAAHAAKKTGLYDADRVADEGEPADDHDRDEQMARILHSNGNPKEDWDDLSKDDQDIWIAKGRRANRKMRD